MDTAISTAPTGVKGSKHITTQLIVFNLQDAEYGIEIEQVKEVVLTPEIASMPETPPFIKGVANIRGNLIAILDLVERFGLKKEEAGKTPSRENLKHATAGKEDQKKEVSTLINMLEEGVTSYSLVIENDGYTIGILLEKVPDTLAIPEDAIDETSSIIGGNGTVDHNYIKGIIKDEDRVIILIDIHKIMHMDMAKGETYMQTQHAAN